MRFGRTTQFGTTKADNRFAADDTGPRIGLGGLNRGGNRCAIHAIDLLDMPAVGVKALGPIFGVSDIGVAVNRDPVVVVEIDQFAQLEVAGQAGRFAGNPFHQVTIADNCVGVVVDHFEIGLVKASSQPALGHCHAHPIGKALPQWTGRRFNAGGIAIFRVTRGLALPLAEVLQIIQRNAETSQVEQRIEQH